MIAFTNEHEIKDVVFFNFRGITKVINSFSIFQDGTFSTFPICLQSNQGLQISFREVRKGENSG